MIEQDLGIANSLDEQKKQGAGFNFESFLVFIGGWLLYVANCRQSLAYLSGRTDICPAGRSTGDCDSCRLQLPVEHAGPMCRPGL